MIFDEEELSYRDANLALDSHLLPTPDGGEIVICSHVHLRLQCNVAAQAETLIHPILDLR